MEILGQFWWIFALAGVIAFTFSILLRNKRRERAATQFSKDRATLASFFEGFDRNEVNAYMTLPNCEARLEWLAQNHPEFMEAVVRHDPEQENANIVAFYLDMNLLNGVSTFPNRDDAIDVCRKATTATSLNEYQAVLDKRIEDQRKAAVAKFEAARKLEEIRKEEQKETQRQQSKDRKSAKRYWKSLSKDKQAEFRKARGVTARKKVLRESPSADLNLNSLYNMVMATQFSGIHTHYSSTIDSCVSSGNSHSYVQDSPNPRYDGGGSTHTDTYAHTDNGSHYSQHNYDSSPSYSDSSSSFDSSSSCSFD